MVNYTGGIPLALKVLGSYFHLFRLQSKENWEMALDKLKKVPLNDILNILRISYDGLDKIEKAIFLDVACFFKMTDRHYMEEILNGCDFFVNIGIDNLIDKSLLTITPNQVIQMHNLVQEMGFNIVYQESQEPEERSRLWTPQDSYHVLKYKKVSIDI